MKGAAFKDVIAGHVARNRNLCKLLESKGADLTAKRTIDLHFWADGELAAQRLADVLRGRGWSHVEINPTEDGSVWNVELHIEASVLEVVDHGFVEAIAGLAIDNQGQFDGWGTSV